MPVTYNLIASNVLSSSAASVTFSAIPSTYTDLVLRISTRVSRAVNDSHNCLMTFNNSTSADYSFRFVAGTGTTASSVGISNDIGVFVLSNGNSTTANTFSSNEIYIPNYASSTNKPSSVFDVVENNSATINAIMGKAGLRSNTAAITSIKLDADGHNYLAGSSFYLYGIKNS